MPAPPLWNHTGMKRFLCAALLSWPLALTAAGNGPAVPIADLVDEAIQRPGDGSQICDAPEPVPYRPPIPVYGLAVTQSTYLSEPMKQLLRARRDEVVQELARRLEKLDLLNPPTAPVKRKKPLLPPLYPPAKPDEFEFATETEQNPRSLGGVMLTVMLELDAVELLPQMLHLEDQLYGIIKTAFDNEKAPLPKIETGGFISWQGQGEEFKDVEDWDKLPPALKRRQELFDVQVFDREMLGLMVELLHRKGYAPLASSTLGRIRTLRLRARQLDEDLQKIQSEKDIPADRKDAIAFDKDAGVPYWRWQAARAPFSDQLRAETRGLVEAYLKGTAPATPTGAGVLDQAIAEPGNFSQMCMMPSPVDFEYPLAAYGSSVPRHFSFDNETTLRLQAYRAEVVPTILARLKAIDMTKEAPASTSEGTATSGWPRKSGANPAALTGLLLEAIDATQAVECLPELVRLEAQLHGLLAAAEKDKNAPLPKLDTDSPVHWKSEGSEAADARKKQIFNSRIYQRELLSLMGKMVRLQNAAFLKDTSVEKAYRAGMEKRAGEDDLKEIKSPEDIPWESRFVITWDKTLNLPVHAYRSVVNVPYTEAARQELLKAVQAYLDSVSPEKRTGVHAMVLSPE